MKTSFTFPNHSPAPIENTLPSFNSAEGFTKTSSPSTPLKNSPTHQPKHTFLFIFARDKPPYLLLFPQIGDILDRLPQGGIPLSGSGVMELLDFEDMVPFSPPQLC